MLAFICLAAIADAVVRVFLSKLDYILNSSYTKIFHLLEFCSIFNHGSASIIIVLHICSDFGVVLIILIIKRV
jgi:hypothetical protein